MIAYLRARAREPWTWVAVAVLLGCALLYWQFHGQIYTHVAAGLALFKALTKDGVEREIFRALLARLRPEVPATIPRSEPEMSLVTSLSELLAEAPDFIKVAQDGAAVFAAIEAKNFSGIVTALPQYEADALKVYNDIKALGVAQAVASGTVVAAAPAEPAQAE